ncbi:MAG: universal stress protein [Deltaproteobacteria bacterium]|nr:universal stress protein [Deltaproteobacteria bacterium]
MYQRILVATDLTDASRAAVGTALELARTLGGKVTALHVTEPPYDTRRWFLPLDSRERAFFQQIIDREREAAERLLNEQVKEADPAHHDTSGVSSLVRSGIPSELIVQTAVEEGVGLIVMGTHGRTGLKHALLGSIAERVVRTSPCPVLTVRAR